MVSNMSPTHHVYIMASQRNGTTYIGVTNNLVRRVYEHREKLFTGFSSTYRISKLVYHELHTDVRDAIKREKQLKKWKRAWKVDLIEQSNPEWRDLWFELNQ